MDDLVGRFKKGDRRALARLMTLAENCSPEARNALSQLHRLTGRARVVGLTGPPGSGKSTLVDRITLKYRERGLTVGIIAVDPTSPFTGGALLGDRIRMSAVSMDKGVFIRSMGTRGSLGGLARATGDMIHILDAFGKDVIIVETVGAGQSEVDVAKHAHTTVVVEMPGLGDDIQAIKAGIMEIGDVFVVNKADRDGVEKTMREIEAMLELDQKMGSWMPPVLRTVAREDEGISELVDALDRHWKHLTESGDLDKVVFEQTRAEFLRILDERVADFVLAKVAKESSLDDLVRRITAREIDAYSASESLLTGMR